MKSVSLGEIIDRYEGLLIDAYGVLVSFESALPGAPELITFLEKRSIPYLIVSNGASQPLEQTVARYQDKGLQIPAEKVLTSGTLLKDYLEQHDLVGANVLSLGSKLTDQLVADCGGTPVGLSEDFQIVFVGNQVKHKTLQVMDDTLNRICSLIDQGRTPRLLMPNPDVIYPKTADALGFTAGSLALSLEQALQVRYGPIDGPRFERFGKPYARIFEMARKRVGVSKLLMIGDQMATDIKGALDFGLDAALAGTEGSGVVSSGSGLLDTWGFAPHYILRDLTCSS